MLAHDKLNAIFIQLVITRQTPVYRITGAAHASKRKGWLENPLTNVRGSV